MKNCQTSFDRNLLTLDRSPIITGTQVNYFFVCKRKLWLFSKQIGMEHTSELVQIGSVIHESSYSRKRKEIELEGIKIDFFEKTRGLIHEVKKSRAIEDAHIWQLKYYLYHFKLLGLQISGVLNYPLLRKTLKVELTEEDEIRLEEILRQIRQIVANSTPPEPINASLCKKCSYFEFCYA
nr:CRISPR-associated protein Cas4 [Hippea sp. KM1]